MSSIASAASRSHEVLPVCEDDEALVIADPEHSSGEARFILLGLGSALRVLVVVHGEAIANVIRIISAWNSDPRERPRRRPAARPMKTHYEFSAATKHPYAKRRTPSVPMRLDASTMADCKTLTEATERPYPCLMNLSLRHCAVSGHRGAMSWRLTRDRARYAEPTSVRAGIDRHGRVGGAPAGAA
jgi:uncharacterized DUF497 family protein